MVKDSVLWSQWCPYRGFTAVHNLIGTLYIMLMIYYRATDVVYIMKSVLKTTCIEGPPVCNGHYRPVHEPFKQYYFTST